VREFFLMTPGLDACVRLPTPPTTEAKDSAMQSWASSASRKAGGAGRDSERSDFSSEASLLDTHRSGAGAIEGLASTTGEVGGVPGGPNPSEDGPAKARLVGSEKDAEKGVNCLGLAMGEVFKYVNTTMSLQEVSAMCACACVGEASI
jgi:hypothetical protein